MTLKSLKRKIRRIGHQLGILTDWEQVAADGGGGPSEKPPSWYDDVYSRSESYQAPYTKSCYYFLWSVIADRLLLGNTRGVLDIGCGPGQMAALLYDQGIRQYVGLDFSPTAVEIARKVVPSFQFVVGDVRTTDVFETTEHDAIICTEVLEHIEDDLQVLSRFGPGKRCLCTVPNFPYTSHVRHFDSAEEVVRRYGPYFSEFGVRAFRGSRTPTEMFFLFDGVRNDVRAVRGEDGLNQRRPVALSQAS
jgi:SAM-dependent methyltransferase